MGALGSSTLQKHWGSCYCRAILGILLYRNTGPTAPAWTHWAVTTAWVLWAALLHGYTGVVATAGEHWSSSLLLLHENSGAALPQGNTGVALPIAPWWNSVTPLLKDFVLWPTKLYIHFFMIVSKTILKIVFPIFCLFYFQLLI